MEKTPRDKTLGEPQTYPESLSQQASHYGGQILLSQRQSLRHRKQKGETESQPKYLTTLKGIPGAFLRWALMSTHPRLKIAQCGQQDGEKWWVWRVKQTVSCNTGILQGLENPTKVI